MRASIPDLLAPHQTRLRTGLPLIRLVARPDLCSGRPVSDPPEQGVFEEAGVVAIGVVEGAVSAAAFVA